MMVEFLHRVGEKRKCRGRGVAARHNLENAGTFTDSQNPHVVRCALSHKYGLEKV